MTNLLYIRLHAGFSEWLRILNFEPTSKRDMPKMLAEFLDFLEAKDCNHPHDIHPTSLFKEDYPWIFEVGLETYRNLKTVKSPLQRKKAIHAFDDAMQMANHPLMREFHDKTEESQFMLHEMRHMTMHYLDRYVANSHEHGDEIDK